ncbi:transglutaminase-like domain-containing protein [Actinotalea sp. M2MS4P-6]|uniref:transglutaminase-like domain-containing protein n=1 Tax=Actinotalea sp. M2MS4P-6 TaxID=2983762 RepID=UPI0021E4D0E9|nr:transglutaminase-like domain-containing protein [Actinotalea sp. M2MS4P-6]MCV2395613.1 transglutaminase-like domain-containing protein [Actinotalea sp. M2MS4P-6]
MRSRPEADVLVLTVAIALGLLPLVPVFGATTLIAPVVAGLLVGVIVALLSARLRWGAAVTTAAALAAYLLVGPAVAMPDATVLRVLPRPQSLLDLLAGAVTSWKQVLTLDPELGATGVVLVAPFVLALVASLAALSLALRASRRTGALAAAVPVVVLVVSVLLGTKVTVVPVVAGVAMVLGLVTWASWRVGTFAPRRVASLAVVAVVVGALGAVTGPWVVDQRPRFVLRDEIVPPFDPAAQASPLSAFRKFVKDWDETDLLTVRGLPEGALVRIATMDAYDGVVWDVAGAEAAEGSGTFRRVGSDVDTQTRRGEIATVEMQVDHLPFVWLPTVGWTRQITFTNPDLRSELRYNEATGTAAMVDTLPDGLTWTAEVVVPPVPDADALESAEGGSVVLPELQRVPDEIAAAASDFAGNASRASLIADALAQTLHDEGWFSHGLTAQGQAASLSGHGADRMVSLLSTMVGDGEQYASAMALMARERGLPARVVLGFRPDGASDEVTFTGADIQAWVEINYAGYGWVPYFPTPDESRTPEQSTAEEPAAADPQLRQPPPPPQQPVTAPDDDTEQPQTDDNQDVSEDSQLWAIVGRVALVGGVPLVLLLGPPLLVGLLKRRRRGRRRRAEEPLRRVVGGWDELLDEATDLRRDLPEQATRRELAVALAGSFGSRASGSPHGGRRAVGIGGPVATLAVRADAAVFGGAEPNDAEVESYWRQVDDAVSAMRSAVPRRVRWRSRWSVASLRRRPRGRPD